MLIARKPYPSDVSDDESALVAAYRTLLRRGAGWPMTCRPGRSSISKRSAGCARVALKLWRRIRTFWRAWQTAGMLSPARPSSIAETLRSTPESGAKAGYGDAKRKKGSKLPLAVDTLGRFLALHVTQPTPTIAQRAAVWPRPFKPPPIKAAKSRRRRPAKTASNSKSSNCPKHSAASSSCQDAGLPSTPSVGRPASEDSSMTTERCAATVADLHVVACVGLMLKKVTMLVPVHDRL